MKKNTAKKLGFSLMTALFAVSAASADLVRNPTQVGGSFDVGQIVKGLIYNGSSAPAGMERTENQMITRTGVYLTESGVYNDRLTIQLTIGGLFWYSLPETESFQSRRIYFGPGVGQATGIYAFGADPKNPAATMQFGFFPHKYSEAVNLGEYMYRSGTYPGTLYSGGWSYINSAAYMAQGIRVQVPQMNGMLNHDITFYLERDLEPTNDLSPGYMITVKPTSFVEVGAGVIWSHGISMNSKRLTPSGAQYSKASGRPTIGDTSAVNLCRDSDPNDCGEYTFKGFKTAARASLDVGELLGAEGIRKGDFKVYTEVALLGVENQPFYYEKKSERMPVMVGVNVPTFGLLDRLTFEGEYLKSRFPNDLSTVLQGQLPVPTASQNVDEFTPKENWKWTIYGKRSITTGLSLYAQAASDHLRHFSFAAEPGGRPTSTGPSEWYYVLRLEFGI